MEGKQAPFLHALGCVDNRLVYFAVEDARRVSLGRIYACLSCSYVLGPLDVIKSLDVETMIGAARKEQEGRGTPLLRRIDDAPH